jgi:PPOX class probable F420-dependent enzyme
MIVQPVQVLRPIFPDGYLLNPTAWLEWNQVEQRLSQARHYWLCTVRPDGRPHAVPKWGVWLQGRFYFDGSPQTRHARNLAHNPKVTLHLESGEEVVIVEGNGSEIAKPDPALAQQIAAAYTQKYQPDGYAPQPDQWNEGGLFVITPRVVLAWTKFTDDPTRFIFKDTD